jgi:hypothetical protein
MREFVPMRWRASNHDQANDLIFSRKSSQRTTTSPSGAAILSQARLPRPIPNTIPITGIVKDISGDNVLYDVL